jgi:hypothetical protein
LATPAGFLFRHVALLSLHAWLFVRRRRRALQAVGRVIGQPGPHEAGGVGWPLPSSGRVIIGAVLQTRKHWRSPISKAVSARQRSRLISAPISPRRGKNACWRSTWIFRAHCRQWLFPGEDWLPIKAHWRRDRARRSRSRCSPRRSKQNRREEPRPVATLHGVTIAFSGREICATRWPRRPP